MSNRVNIERNTKETQISLSLDMYDSKEIKLKTGLPFFDHMLNAMAFHGGFSLFIDSTGDIEIDPHHLVEDIGLVLGLALKDTLKKAGGISRYGHAIIPMDDALSEVTVDVAGRPYLHFTADFPQTHAGNFDISLVNEFLEALVNKGELTLHAECKYGRNSHHMAESLFKALGRSIKQSYTIISNKVSDMSTKGVI